MPDDPGSTLKRPPIVVEKAAAEPEPLSTSFQSEEFLFHIYRGSELLADNCVSEAKDELEEALRMQPRDAEGQGLLGIVYFRLGMYPQALRIYSELLQAFPAEITPRVNAALCYLKTGQAGPARELLEEVIRRDPEHKRAWAYLGLTYERLRDNDKACVAYDRAGQPQRAERIKSASQRPASGAQASPEVRQAAADAAREIEDQPTPFLQAEESVAADRQVGRWQAVELGKIPEPRPPSLEVSARSPLPPASIPAPLRSVSPDEYAAEVALALPAEGVVLQTARVALACVKQSAAVRLRGLLGTVPVGAPFRESSLERRMRGRGLGEPLGTVASPMGLLEGQGHLLVMAAEGRQLCVLHLSGQLLYLREARVVAFDGAVHYENGRLARPDGDVVPMVQLSGQGWVIVESLRVVRSVRVNAEPGVTVDADQVLGWTGRLLPRPATRSLVGFVGDGTLLVELPA
jgi:tetratricopeptide (TPR) repeat protein